MLVLKSTKSRFASIEILTCYPFSTVLVGVIQNFRKMTPSKNWCHADIDLLKMMLLSLDKGEGKGVGAVSKNCTKVTLKHKNQIQIS